jgi:hypothetical protein
MTAENDEIVSLAKTNSGRTLLAFFQRYTMLVSTLPQATDPGVFDTRIIEYVSTQRGALGRLSTVEFDAGQGRTLAASADALGLWVTDGVSAQAEWAVDLDWDTLLATMNDVSAVELVNNPKKDRLEMIYEDTSNDYQEYHFYYGRMKQDGDGQASPIITGPHPVGIRCKHYGIAGGTWVGWSGDAGGTAGAAPDAEAFDNLEVWLQADDLDATLDEGEDVTSWTDKSSNAYVFANTETYPVFRADVAGINNHDAVETDNGGKFLTRTGAQIEFSGDWTIAWVSKNPSSGSNLFICGREGSNTEWGIAGVGEGTTDAAVYYNSATRRSVTDAFDNSGNGYHIGVMRRDSSGDHFYLHDGVSKTKSTPYNDSATNMIIDALFRLDDNSSSDPGVQIVELVAYTDYLTDVEAAQLFNYLSTRYGLGTPTATGDVYIEDTGPIDYSFGYNSDGDIPLQIKSGDKYVAGLSEAVEATFGYPKFASGTKAVSFVGTFRRDGASTAVTSTKTFTVGTSRQIYWYTYADRHNVQITDISNTAMPALIGYEIGIRKLGGVKE